MIFQEEFHLIQLEALIDHSPHSEWISLCSFCVKITIYKILLLGHQL